MNTFRFSNPSRVQRFILGVISLALPLAAAAQTTKVESSAFKAEVTSFQTAVAAGNTGNHYITATVHLQNKTKFPLILGASANAFNVTDDQGNRYAAVSFRGIQPASNGSIDTKFVLDPESGSDMLVEFVWHQAPSVIFGVSFDMNMGIRELKKLEGNQYQLGAETPVHFTGLKTGYTSVDTSDHKLDAGPFRAQVTRARFGRSGRWQVVADFTMKLENTTDKPMILAYERSSAYGIDNEGNFYGRGAASANNVQVTGIGEVSHDQADPQFVLAPGESKEVQVTISRAQRFTPGTEFNLYVALQSLEILPSKQIRSLRQYSLAFPKIKM